MNRMSRFLLAGVLAIPILATGCGDHREVRAWGPGETTYYVQWEHQTHRDHAEWESRNDTDHRAYWEWRKHHHE